MTYSRSGHGMSERGDRGDRGGGGARGRGLGNAREERFRVHVEVRFQNALDFVVEYAENLSRGGVFVAGAQGLAPRAEVSCDLALPGLGRFTVLAEVAHVLSAEAAAKLGRSPGAGLQITRSPPGFQDAMSTYLKRLGRRRDTVVMTSDLTCGRFLSSAGFLVRPLPAPEVLMAALIASAEPVAALLVPPGRWSEYHGLHMVTPDLVVPVPEELDPDKLLDVLDARLE